MSDDWFNVDTPAPAAHKKQADQDDGFFKSDLNRNDKKSSSDPYGGYKTKSAGNNNNDDGGWGDSNDVKPKQNGGGWGDDDNNNDGGWGASEDTKPQRRPRSNDQGGGWGGDDDGADERPRRNHNNGEDGDEDKENERPPNTHEPELLDEDGENLYKFGNTAGLNFKKYDKIKVNVNGKNIPPKMDTFQDSDLIDLLKENVKLCKFDEPTPCQKYSIPCILKRRDLMCCAQTGSGKTAAFLLPVLQLLKEEDTPMAEFDKTQKPQVMILCPTRELAIQTFNNTVRLARKCRIRAVMVYGGTTSRFQMGHVEQGANIVIATVGRLADLVRKRKIDLEDTKYVVLDEADRMLDMGFSAEVRSLVAHCQHPERQILMFSATFPPEIQKMASEMMREDYIFVAVGIVGAANPDITQKILDLSGGNKLAKVEELLDENAGKKILIFVKTKKNADFLASKLSVKKHNATSIHGDRLQDQREQALSEFDKGIRKILVATSVASRGLDIPAVDMVINYDMPDEIGDYVHRIGRTGRVGNCGVAISFVDSEKDNAVFPGLMRTLKDSEQEVPSWLAESVSGEAYQNSAGDFNATTDIREYSSNARGGDSNRGMKPQASGHNNDDGDDWGDSAAPAARPPAAAQKQAPVSMGGDDDLGW